MLFKRGIRITSVPVKARIFYESLDHQNYLPEQDF